MKVTQGGTLTATYSNTTAAVDMTSGREDNKLGLLGITGWGRVWRKLLAKGTL